jgi:hypothetical protein
VSSAGVRHHQNQPPGFFDCTRTTWPWLSRTAVVVAFLPALPTAMTVRLIPASASGGAARVRDLVLGLAGRVGLLRHDQLLAVHVGSPRGEQLGELRRASMCRSADQCLDEPVVREHGSEVDRVFGHC